MLRNYWMYERTAGRSSSSRAALSQGLWPRFPGMTGAPAVRLQTAVAPPRLNPIPQAAPQITFDPGVIAAASSSAIIGSR